MSRNPYKDICLNRTPIGSILIIYDSRKKKEVWLARLLAEFITKYGKTASRMLTKYLKKNLRDPNILVTFEDKRGLLGVYYNKAYHKYTNPKIGKHFEIVLNPDTEINLMKKPKWIMWAYGNVFLHELLHLHGHKDHGWMEQYLIPFNLWLADRQNLWKDKRTQLTAEIVHLVFGNSELIQSKYALTKR